MNLDVKFYPQSVSVTIDSATMGIAFQNPIARDFGEDTLLKALKNEVTSVSDLEKN